MKNNKWPGPPPAHLNKLPPIPWRFHMKFGFSWPSGFREDIWTHTHTHYVTAMSPLSAARRGRGFKWPVHKNNNWYQIAVLTCEVCYAKTWFSCTRTALTSPRKWRQYIPNTIHKGWESNQTHDIVPAIQWQGTVVKKMKWCTTALQMYLKGVKKVRMSKYGSHFVHET